MLFSTQYRPTNVILQKLQQKILCIVVVPTLKNQKKNPKYKSIRKIHNLDKQAPLNQFSRPLQKDRPKCTQSFCT